MLSEADTRTIDACRQVLRDLATASKNEAYFGGTIQPSGKEGLPMLTGEVYVRGRFAAICNMADHALAAVFTEAATYLDDVHAAASLPGPRPLEP